ncbi:MAG: hypothetical protein KTR31_34390 [Myxococcales bacterium]|nr:hypothetical protein [Myxococcales bacterium]
MTIHDDAFTTRELPDRLFYAAGVFLDAEDMAAEQTYHRGRLSRALAYLHGSGTAAGLRVLWDADSTELRVEAGLAVDRIGRLVEVPRQACVRLADWLDQQRQEAAATPGGVSHPLQQAVTPAGTELVVDVFVRFVVCERGRTPAFATGPYDAIDASQPHRLRDSYELTLELRGHDATLPVNPFPERTTQTIDTYLSDLRTFVLDNAWVHGTEWAEGQLPADPGTVGVDDTTSVFLARVSLPVTLDGDSLPVWNQTAGVLDAPTIDNDSRSFVYSAQALYRLFEALIP